MISRIAPTPSGYLHLGNALNFALTWVLVRKRGGQLRLRIDDLDTPRTRVEYLHDVFETLNWMKLDWDLGPKSLREHQREYSQALRFNRYLDAVHVLIESGQAFVCSCSRRELQRESCSCKRKTLTFDSKNTVVRAGDSEGDFVIWRREGFAAYHLVSLLDDLDSGVNLIVRGEDLRASTGVQIRLAKMLGRHFEAERFEKVEFIHHPLILGKSGEKLSKSNHALSLRQQFDRKASPDELYREISLNLGIRKPCCSLGELLTVFQE